MLCDSCVNNNNYFKKTGTRNLINFTVIAESFRHLAKGCTDFAIGVADVGGFVELMSFSMCQLYVLRCGALLGCQVALGLGLDGLPVVNSSGGSRLWKWSGRDAAHPTSASNDAVAQSSQNYGSYSCMLDWC